MARLERSELSVPASNFSMIEKAVASDADVTFLDLEDSVAPDTKASSRKNVVRALRELDWGKKPPAYRVNGLDTPFFYRDVIDVVEAAGDMVDLIILPKIHRPEDLAVADTLLAQIEQNIGLEPGKIKVEAQIESARGLMNAARIAQASARLETLIFGPGDFSATMRMPMARIGATDWWDEQYPGHRLHYALAQVMVAARAAGLRAIDGPLADFRELEAFRRACTVARGLGYDGKWCIHPRQIPIANELFLPSREELSWARRVVDAYERATAEGKGVITVEDAMIDMASVRMAQTTLELARQAGME